MRVIESRTGQVIQTINHVHFADVETDDGDHITVDLTVEKPVLDVLAANTAVGFILDKAKRLKEAGIV